MPNPIVGAIASVAGGVIGSKGAKSAAKSAAASEQAGIDFQRESRDLALGYNKPYRDAGYNALSALMDMAGLSRPPPSTTQPNATESAGSGEFRLESIPGGKGAMRRVPVGSGARKTTQPVGPGGDAPDMGGFAKYDWQKNNPGYAFRLEEGQRATENLLRSAGMLNSGKGLRAITRYGQDYASNEYDKAWGRLSAIAGLGGNAVTSGNQIIGNSANSIQQGYSNIGQAGAAGAVGSANAWSGAVNDAAVAFGDWLGKKPVGSGPVIRV
jgi:hypothetical protein